MQDPRDRAVDRVVGLGEAVRITCARGDIVDVEVDGTGTLRNPLVELPSAA